MDIEEKKSELNKFFAQIYEKCGKDYFKYVAYIEQLENSGQLKTEHIPRDNVKTIWNT